MARKAYHIKPVKRGEIALVYFYSESTIEVWDVYKRTRLGKPFPVSSGGMLSALFGDTLCISGGDEGGVYAVDLGSGELLWRQPKVSNLVSLQANEANKVLFCNCDLGKLVVLDAVSGEIVIEHPDIGECFCSDHYPIIAASDGENVRFLSWPSFKIFGLVQSRSFAVLAAQFTLGAALYSEVKSGVTFVCMDPVNGSVVPKHVADGHFIELAYNENKQLFVGLDIAPDPNRLLFFDALSGTVEKVVEGWDHHGVFVAKGHCILTRGGTMIDVESGDVLCEKLFG